VILFIATRLIINLSMRKNNKNSTLFFILPYWAFLENKLVISYSKESGEFLGRAGFEPA